jgi:acetolactate synthase-1/2/3 large subunit
MEIDTFARHGLGLVAVIGNDACWTQIAREQVEVLGDDVGCALARTDYHESAAGLGGEGIVVRHPGELKRSLAHAFDRARHGKAVVVNVHLGKTDFRKGSISI